MNFVAEDLLVGLVAVVLGLSAFASAVWNWDRSYQLRKAQWIESNWGRGAARLIYGVLGLGLIILGIAIASGFGPNKSVGRKQSRPNTAELNREPYRSPSHRPAVLTAP